MKHEKEIMGLHHYKKINYKEAYNDLLEDIEERHPEIDLKTRYSIICFWDSTTFSFIGEENMRDLDSLAGTLGEVSYNFIYATEMNETAAIGFLKRNNAMPKHMTVIGDLDNYMSGVFTEKPPNVKHVFMGCDTVKNKDWFESMKRMKHKPFYFMIDTTGKIIYSNGKMYLPSKDLVFVKMAREGATPKSLKNID